MKKISFNCDNKLALRITEYIANIFFHAQGSTEEQFKSLCCEEFKTLVILDSVCWDVVPDSSKLSQLPISDRTIVLQKYQIQTDSIHIFSIARDEHKSTLSPTDINITKFMFPQLVEAYYQNKLSTLKQHNSLPNCYIAVCDSQLNIVEAEANFFKLLNKYFDEQWNQGQLPIINVGGWETKSKIELNNIKFNLARLGDSIYITAYYNDPRFNSLTPQEKKITILMLKRTPEIKILSDLNITRKTLDHHLRKICSKFDMASKKELIPNILNTAL